MLRVSTKKLKQICLGICALILVITAFGSTGVKVKASDMTRAKQDAEADLRLIFTTDIHGQLASMDYETGTNSSVGGLARAYSAIKQARSEVSNYMTFDVGDVMYDYTTEYISTQNQSVLQPIFQAMGTIGYDAMTLGNHEFDYEWDYMLNQYKIGDFMDKIVVSNLTYSKNGSYPFKENMIITKKLKTTTGQTVSVKVGVIGETFPYISTKVQDLTGTLRVESLVSNVTAEAAKLKAQGADLVVVLSHSGMGPENATELDNNASYALTKIDDVDVVLCGHEHNRFPSETQSGAYYKLRGVDKSTNLVNGKLLVMSQDRCKTIGLADMKLKISNGEVEIIDQKPQVRDVTSDKYQEDKSISSLYDDWSSKLLEYSQNKIGTVAPGKTIENYNGLIEDNSAIQLLNDAKRAYALNYIHNTKEEYVGYPVIAVSSYVSYGGESYLDYVKINGDMTESDLASLQIYNGYTALYKITGAQLREWLEWSASAFETPNGTTPWTDSTMSSYMQSSGLKSLIAEPWLNNWGSFYVFDGIEYTISPAAAARYDINGNKVNTTTRVTSMTYDGQPIKDDQVFVLAANKLSKTCDVTQPIKNQSIYKGYVRTQGIIRDYIKELCKLGTLDVKPDYNWNVSFLNSTYQFIVKTTSMGSSLTPKRDWFVKDLGTTADYDYSIGSFNNRVMNEKPKLIVTSTNQDVTNSRVKVAVEATSVNGVAEIRYMSGEQDDSYAKWTSAYQITGHYFYATTNGIYTVYVRDKKGQVTTQQILIDNIYENALSAPKVATYTNRKTAISGKADPLTKIVIEVGGKTYSTMTDGKGEFSAKIPAQKSGTQLTVYASNEVKNYRSKEVTVKVKRTGPNKPVVYDATNTSDVLSGNVNDDDGEIIAIIDDTVYCGTKEGKARFLKCKDLYKDTYKVVVTSITVDDRMEYQLTVPVQPIGTSVATYSIDHLYRKSMKNSQKIIDAGPNPPVIYELISIDNHIYGTVTSSSSKATYDVFVNVGDRTYTGTTDASGDFMIPVDENVLVPGQEVSVYATDKVGGLVRGSYTSKITVEDPASLVHNDSDLKINGMSVGDITVGGCYEPNEPFYVAVVNRQGSKIYEAETDDSGDYEVTLQEPLKSQDKVYIYTRLTYGGIVEMVCDSPSEIVPSKPVIETAIGNDTTSVVVTTDTVAKIVMTIGTKSYNTSKYVYDEELAVYRYTLTIKKPKAGESITVTAQNSAGTSKKTKATVSCVVPETPTVDKILSGTKKVAGVIKTSGKTTVFVQIGSKVYESKAKATGKFSVTVPTTKQGTKLVVYGKNTVGAGSKATVTVLKAPKKAKTK